MISDGEALVLESVEYFAFVFLKNAKLFSLRSKTQNVR